MELQYHINISQFMTQMVQSNQEVGSKPPPLTMKQKVEYNSLLLAHLPAQKQLKNATQQLLEGDQYFHNMFIKDKKFKLNANFLQGKIINIKMRTKLVKWMINFCQSLDFKVDTIFLSVTILDRYLSLSNEDYKVLQLIGATTIYISSKILQTSVFPPEAYSISCKNVFAPEALLKKEKEILMSLDFHCDLPYSLKFLRSIKSHIKMEDQIYKRCKQILLTMLQSETYSSTYLKLELAQLSIILNTIFASTEDVNEKLAKISLITK